LYFSLLSFLVKDQKEICGQHENFRIDGTVDCALVVDVQIDPRSDVIEIALLVCPEIDEIDAVEVKRLLVTPTFQRIRSRETLHRRFDDGD